MIVYVDELEAELRNLATGVGFYRTKSNLPSIHSYELCFMSIYRPAGHKKIITIKDYEAHKSSKRLKLHQALDEQIKKAQGLPPGIYTTSIDPHKINNYEGYGLGIIAVITVDKSIGKTEYYKKQLGLYSQYGM